jgi:hypothetical protein
MRNVVQSLRTEAEAQARELLQAIEAAEGVIVSTIERECAALRAGQMLAAQALRVRLRDAAKLYINLTRAARASLWTLDQVVPGISEILNTRRDAFAALLRVELAVLAAERAASEQEETPPEEPVLSARPAPLRAIRRRRERRRRAG